MMTGNQKKIFYAVLIVMEFVVILAGAEMLIYILSPQDTLYPRYQFSAKYGLALFPDTEMVHKRPGKYLYRYTVNHAGYRGPYIDAAQIQDKKRIVVLGDSYSFGTGVQDGEQYPSVLQQALGSSYAVINLGNPAWTLTQQIKRFYETGKAYKPDLVILQFFENDPDELLKDQVTQVENGKLVFRDTDNRMQWIKKWMSKSWLQKSQLYNFVRQSIYLFMNKRKIEKLKKELSEQGVETEGNIGETKYCELLVPFARDLKASGIRFAMIAVNHSLDNYPKTKECINGLEAEGSLEFIDVLPWFDGMKNFASPEGHYWGTQAHKIVGENLAEKIETLDLSGQGGEKSE